jgi:radical SAM superfamily enzyme
MAVLSLSMIGGITMKIMLCQISNRVINPPQANGYLTAAEFMYKTQWEAKESYGYWKTEDFWELPLWIGEVTHALKRASLLHYHNPEFDVELHIVTPENLTKPVGGYVDPAYFRGAPITWCHSVEQFCQFLDVRYEYGVDWSLFKGTKCIPRLTMSYGCSHNCKFCTVPNKVEEVSWSDIYQQVDAMKNLKFKLVYLNDKTWGMAENHEGLIDVYNHIRHFNPEFEGFIIQTSVALMQSFENRLMDKITGMQNAHIKVIELGIETFNNDLLREYRKPQREKSMTHVVEMLSEKGFHVIANLILGLPGETKFTYYRTLGWLAMNYQHLFGVNINTLALYHDTVLGKELDGEERDLREQDSDRSFWTDQERRDYNEMKDKFYDLITEIWCERRTNVPTID